MFAQWQAHAEGFPSGRGGGGRGRADGRDVGRPPGLRDARRRRPRARRQRRTGALGEAGAALLEAADAAGGEPAAQVHVATEDGEAFAVRHGGLAMVAVADRFTLASLMIFDMRAVLRDLAGSG